MSRSPIEKDNFLLEKTTPLTGEDKALFKYFGERAKILPPLRILNPQNIIVGDVTAIREGCHINAFRDLRFLMDYIDPAHRGDFDPADYVYDSEIVLGREIQIGRFAFMSCTRSITLEDNVLFSERVFVGDNNHSFSHREVPIMQQPNKPGDAVLIGRGTWVGVGAAVLAGTRLGKNCVVGANSVCKGEYPDYAVIAVDPSPMQYRRFDDDGGAGPDGRGRRGGSEEE